MIEQIIQYLWLSIKDNIDWLIVAIVILSGYFQSYYMKEVKLSDAIKTLIVSFIATTVYLWLNGDLIKSDSLARFFFSYFFATSMYEVAIKPIRKWIDNKLNNGLGDLKKPD